MRPYCFLLASLLALACAPHVAHANPPCADDGDGDGDGDEKTHEHEHEHDHAHAHGPPWRATGATGTIDEVRDAKPNGQLEVHAFAGSVHVTGWAQNQIKVHAMVNGDCRVDIRPSGDRYAVRLECARDPGTADIEIQAPQGSAVEVRTMSAAIAMQGINGALRLQSVAGDISVKGGTPSDIEARSTSGGVQIDAASPQVRAQSVSGDVRVVGVRGKASVHTVSGDCNLSGGDFSEARIESISGEIAFTGGVVGTFEVQSHSGDVAIHLPAATNADVELRSFSGDLEVDMGNGKKAAERELDAKLGVGGPRIRVRSFSGDVRVSR